MPQGTGGIGGIVTGDIVVRGACRPEASTREAMSSHQYESLQVTTMSVKFPVDRISILVCEAMDLPKYTQYSAGHLLFQGEEHTCLSVTEDAGGADGTSDSSRIRIK